MIPLIQTSAVISQVYNYFASYYDISTTKLYALGESWSSILMKLIVRLMLVLSVSLG